MILMLRASAAERQQHSVQTYRLLTEKATSADCLPAVTATLLYQCL